MREMYLIHMRLLYGGAICIPPLSLSTVVETEIESRYCRSEFSGIVDTRAVLNF